MKSIFVIIILMTSYVGFADVPSSDAEAVMTMRQEVEVLASEIEVVKKMNQSHLDVYIQREQELSSMLLREKFKTDQINSQINVGKNKIFQNQVNIKNSKKSLWITDFWPKYEDSLKKSNPLYANKIKERLEKIKLDFRDKRISYEHALIQTWFLIDEDLKKSQDSEYHLAPLNVNGETYNVEMVRLGRTKGYFRTAQGQYGLMEHKGKWILSYFEDKKSKDMIESLLVQFKQQQKTGLYNLPGIKL